MGYGNMSVSPKRQYVSQSKVPTGLAASNFVLIVFGYELKTASTAGFAKPPLFFAALFPVLCRVVRFIALRPRRRLKSSVRARPDCR
jgi:hypothetical protein